MLYEYHRGKLNGTLVMVYDMIKAGLEREQDMILFPAPLKREENADLVKMVQKDHPEIFYVNFYEYRYRADKTTGYLYPRYLYKGKQRARKAQEIETAVRTLLLTGTKKNLKTDLEKCRWIHDRLVRNIIYDMEVLEGTSEDKTVYTIEGVFCKKKAVCAGISHAFKLLADRMNLKAIVVFGEADTEAVANNCRHAWNIVRIGEDYVQVDTTWDGNQSRAVNHYRYDFFALSDSEFMRRHRYSEGADYPICKTMKYSYFANCGCYLKNPEQLKSYLEKTLNTGKKVLYFKIAGEVPDRRRFAGKVDQLAEKMIGKRCAGMRYYKVIQKEELVFFYRIE